MNLIEIIFLAGAHCVSPLETVEGFTEASKVACAVVVKQDRETAEIEIFPKFAASDPVVIALLGRSLSAGSASVPVPSDVVIEPTSLNTTSAETADATDSVEPPVAPVKQVRMAKRKAARDANGLNIARKKMAVRLRDKCGSYRAVWYTNKDGRRKYRCVRT